MYVQWSIGQWKISGDITKIVAKNFDTLLFEKAMDISLNILILVRILELKNEQKKIPKLLCAY